MTKFTKEMSLQQFAAAVAADLKDYGIDVVLTGGAVVSIYSNGKFVSQDADFICAVDQKTVVQAMRAMGFKNIGKDFYHDGTDFSVEFPGSQLMIGSSHMTAEGKIEVNGFTLRLLSPTQCVMDRLAAYYHWRDRQSLDQALLVAQSHPINLRKVEAWSKDEGEGERFKEFLGKLSALRKKRRG